LERELPPLMQQWQAIKTKDIPALNAQLKNANLPEIKLEISTAGSTATAAFKDED